MTEPADLAIIIVSWNTVDLLSKCLRSIQAAEVRSNPWRIVTVVVDNASTDGTPDLVREEFPWVKLIGNSQNEGFARGCNKGIRQTASQYVMLLNPDTELLSQAVDALLVFLDAYPEAAACGPMLLNRDGSLQPSCHPVLTPGREAWRLLFLDRLVRRATYPMHRWAQDEPRQVEVLKGACLMVRREALDQVGLLDERYFMYSEEMDLCYRLSSVGWKLFWVPDARVIHYGGESTRQAPVEMTVALYRSKVQFVRKFSGAWGVRYLKVVLLTAFLPRWAVAAVGQTLYVTLAARAQAYRALLAQLPQM